MVHRLSGPFKPAVSVACGENHVLVLDCFGAVFSFGLGCDGQLGHGDAESRPQPCWVQSLSDECVVQVAAGSCHNLVLASSFSQGARMTKIFAWGLNEEGQLGIGTRQTCSWPQRVTAGKRSAVLVSCGDFHSACLCENGFLYTWGYGRGGRLGHGNEEDKLTPALVRYHIWTTVSCGSTFTIAAAWQKGIYATGQGFDGQLGMGWEGQGAYVTRFASVDLGLEFEEHDEKSTSWNRPELSTRDGCLLTFRSDFVLAWGNTGSIAGNCKSFPERVPALHGAQEVAIGGSKPLTFALSIDADGSRSLWTSGKDAAVRRRICTSAGHNVPV
eukprot:TRINITY_DN12832_c0_g1_i5.p1 TRINITY_DN12832_c0_g1~~TRINITY_DN12832_c0_g1_i5.p1  ORF type:complete len:329 (-),score=37.23 TRINITY_DN12832_c0_g1_i5:334-1320(-)